MSTPSRARGTSLTSLVVLRRSGASGQRYTLDTRGWCLIGSHSECDIIVRSSGVAKLHALVRLDDSDAHSAQPASATVFGLDTELPTVVPSKKTSLFRDEGAALEHGDSFVVGERAFRFERVVVEDAERESVEDAAVDESTVQPLTPMSPAAQNILPSVHNTPSPSPSPAQASSRRTSLLVLPDNEKFLPAAATRTLLTARRMSLPANRVADSFFAAAASSKSPSTKRPSASGVAAKSRRQTLHDPTHPRSLSARKPRKHARRDGTYGDAGPGAGEHDGEDEEILRTPEPLPPRLRRLLAAEEVSEEQQVTPPLRKRTSPLNNPAKEEELRMTPRRRSGDCKGDVKRALTPRRLATAAPAGDENAPPSATRPPQRLPARVVRDEAGDGDRAVSDARLTPRRIRGPPRGSDEEDSAAIARRVAADSPLFAQPPKRARTAVKSSRHRAREREVGAALATPARSRIPLPSKLGTKRAQSAQRREGTRGDGEKEKTVEKETASRSTQRKAAQITPSPRMPQPQTPRRALLQDEEECGDDHELDGIEGSVGLRAGGVVAASENEDATVVDKDQLQAQLEVEIQGPQEKSTPPRKSTTPKRRKTPQSQSRWKKPLGAERCEGIQTPPSAAPTTAAQPVLTITPRDESSTLNESEPHTFQGHGPASSPRPSSKQNTSQRLSRSPRTPRRMPSLFTTTAPTSPASPPREGQSLDVPGKNAILQSSPASRPSPISLPPSPRSEADLPQQFDEATKPQEERSPQRSESARRSSRGSPMPSPAACNYASPAAVGITPKKSTPSSFSFQTTPGAAPAVHHLALSEVDHTEEVEQLFAGITPGAGMRPRKKAATESRASALRRRSITPEKQIRPASAWKRCLSQKPRSAIMKSARKSRRGSAALQKTVLFADSIGADIELPSGPHYSPPPKSRTPSACRAKAVRGREEVRQSEQEEEEEQFSPAQTPKLQPHKRLFGYSLPQPSPTSQEDSGSSDSSGDQQTATAPVGHALGPPPTTPLGRLGLFFYPTRPRVPLLTYDGAEDEANSTSEDTGNDADEDTSGNDDMVDEAENEGLTTGAEADSSGASSSDQTHVPVPLPYTEDATDEKTPHEPESLSSTPPPRRASFAGIASLATSAAACVYRRLSTPALRGKAPNTDEDVEDSEPSGETVATSESDRQVPEDESDPTLSGDSSNETDDSADPSSEFSPGGEHEGANPKALIDVVSEEEHEGLDDDCLENVASTVEHHGGKPVVADKSEVEVEAEDQSTSTPQEDTKRSPVSETEAPDEERNVISSSNGSAELWMSDSEDALDSIDSPGPIEGPGSGGNSLETVDMTTPAKAAHETDTPRRQSLLSRAFSAVFGSGRASAVDAVPDEIPILADGAAPDISGTDAGKSATSVTENRTLDFAEEEEERGVNSSVIAEEGSDKSSEPVEHAIDIEQEQEPSTSTASEEASENDFASNPASTTSPEISAGEQPRSAQPLVTMQTRQMRRKNGNKLEARAGESDPNELLQEPSDEARIGANVPSNSQGFFSGSAPASSSSNAAIGRSPVPKEKKANFESYTVKELRLFLGGLGISCNGMKKDKLVELAYHTVDRFEAGNQRQAVASDSDDSSTDSEALCSEPDPVRSISEADVVDPLNNVNDLSSLKVIDLQNRLRELGLGTTGRKAELVARLSENQVEDQQSAHGSQVASRRSPRSSTDEDFSSKTPRTDIRRTRRSTATSAQNPVEKPAQNSTIDYSLFTVKQLKQILEERHLDTTGRKQDLVDRLSATDCSSGKKRGSASASKHVRQVRFGTDGSSSDDGSAGSLTTTSATSVYNNWTVVFLKKELQRRNLSTSGKKAALVERLHRDD